MEQNLRISVLMATFNGASHLREQMDSIINQVGPEFFLYISDDGSTDSTPYILQEYVQKFPQKIQVLPSHSHKRGALANFLNLLEKVDSDLYLFADQDDIWTPDHVQTLYEKYQCLSDFEKTKPGLVFSDMKIIRADGRLVADSFLAAEKLPCDRQKPHFYFVQNNISGCVSLFNQALKKRVFDNPELLWKNLEKIPMHDFFLATTAASLGNIYFVPKALSSYRMHDKNTLGVQDVTSGKHILERLKMQSADTTRAMQYAAFFVEYFKKRLDMGEHQIIQRFAHLKFEPKFKRVLFVLRHGFLKFGFLRKCVQLWNV